MVSGPEDFSLKERRLIIGAALLALFLGALDSLIMSAAMPTIVAELGGLPLYAWVYSAYFLARAISLPIFGKLADIYDTKKLFLFSITLFLLASIAAGSANSMGFLIFCRIFQGIGAGGNFAYVYIVLSDVSLPGKRGQTLSLGSTIWGLSSVIGPTLGGIIVTYFSWRWIFFINIPLGLLSLIGIALWLKDTRTVPKSSAPLDFAGLCVFSTFVLGLLILFIAGGRDLHWDSPFTLFLILLTGILGAAFIVIEKKAENPMINLSFFQIRNYSLGNGAIFFASCTIFSFFAYVPLYIQGSLVLSPMQVGLAMVSLSLGWSAGAFLYGRVSKEGRAKIGSIVGAGLLLLGTVWTLRFNLQTTMLECFSIFLLVGFGMGVVALATLILVQDSVSKNDLGIVTSFHQFCRSLGGTVGVGIGGGFVTSRLLRELDESATALPAGLMRMLQESTENLLRPEFQRLVPPESMTGLKMAVLSGVYGSFVVATCTSILCLLCCIFLEYDKKKE